MVKKISFKNYKLFRSKQTLELRPITILIGKNNSGKSAVAKLPTMISRSLKGKLSVPIQPQNDGISLGSGYENLVYNGYTTDNLEFDISTDSEKLSIAIYADRNNKIYFSQYVFNNFNIDVENNTFKGFIQEGNKFETLHLNYDYIGPFRRLPESNYPNDFNEYNKIGIEGENAYPILIQWSENKDPIFSKISQWYKDNFEGWGLKVSQIAGLAQTYEIGLENKDLRAVNLLNVGQGIHQVLPLIVRSYMPTKKETLIIIEEPETHLHPAAHGNLAQRLAESYLEDKKNKRYLIEAHSQNFVLRLRKLIAEGTLKPEEVVIYYVDFDEDKRESSLQLIEIDKFGGVSRWPEGVFNETSKEVRTIYNAQLNKPAHVDRD